MTFIYFFPGHPGVIKRADFESRGLGYALAAAGDPDSAAVAAGPEGKPGVLAVVPGPAAAVLPSYKPELQRWRKGPSKWFEGKELGFYVGCSKSQPPGPEQLARETVYPGNAVRLRDGHDWVIPRVAAILPDRGSTLPRVLDLGDDCETVVTKVDPRFEAVANAAFKFWMDFSGQSEEKDRQTGREQIELAVAALQVNYKIGKVEAIGLLSLWGTDELGKILRATIDADEIAAFLQKKTSLAAEPGAAPSGSLT